MDNQNNNLIPDEEDICVTLDLDDGTQAECEILTIFEINGQDYIVLLPNEENEDEDEINVYIYRYFEDEDGNASLDNILDDEEYAAAEEKFGELIDEEISKSL